MAPRTMPPEVKKAVKAIVDDYNAKNLSQFGVAYCPRFRGQSVYLDRDDGNGHLETANEKKPLYRLFLRVDNVLEAAKTDRRPGMEK